MTVRRRGGNAAAGTGEPAPKPGGVELIDELVMKTLAINPALAQGREAMEVLQGLRQDVLNKSQGLPAPAAPAPSGDSDARAEAIDIFLRDKSRTFPEMSGRLRDQVAALEAQLGVLREDTTKGIVDLMRAMMETGLDVGICRRVIGRYRDLWTALQVSEAELLARLQKK